MAPSMVAMVLQSELSNIGGDASQGATPQNGDVTLNRRVDKERLVYCAGLQGGVSQKSPRLLVITTD